MRRWQMHKQITQSHRDKYSEKKVKLMEYRVTAGVGQGGAGDGCRVREEKCLSEKITLQQKLT